MSMITDDIDRLNDIDMFQRRPNTELSSHLLLVLPLRLALPLRSELLDRIDHAAILTRRFDKTDSPTGTGPKHTSPFAILLTQMSMRGF